MGTKKTLLDFVKNLNVGEAVADYLVEIIEKKIKEEKADREEFEKKLADMSEEDLEKIYVPDVYQKDIYSIDYERLKANHITLLSFDIDDTINDSIKNKVINAVPGLELKMPKEAKELFVKLKEMGFTVKLLTNTNKKIAQDACKQLKADGYIARAEKPQTKNFEKMLKDSGLDKSQMVHIGNSIRDDVAGGNAAGVITCLVRRAGVTMKLAKFVSMRLDVPTKGHLIRERLLECDIWRKHHKYHRGDQYYQLGEIPAYQQ